MAEQKSDKELATELTLEYMKGLNKSYIDQMLKAWCSFYKTIQTGTPTEEGK